MHARMRRSQMAADRLQGPGPIGDGETRHTSIPDNLEGIKFEVGKLRDYVVYFSRDPLVTNTVEKLAHACPSKNKYCLANAIFEWCKRNFIFVNDPYAAEKIKTGRRMMRDLATPKEILAAILAPLLGAQIQDSVLPPIVVSHKFPSDPAEFRKLIESAASWTPSAKVVEDCDGAATFVATMLAAGGIKPRFVLGGNPNAQNGECEWHHIWVQANTDKGWVDLDVSEPISTFGWKFPFRCANYVEIFE